MGDMKMNRGLAFFVASLAIDLTVGRIDESIFAPKDIITKEVAILGGGASGTFAAVSLREDFNTSIIVIELKNRLGGHVDTYAIPDTNTTIDYGVQSYMHYGPTDAFFKRMGVGFGGTYSPRRSMNLNVDLESGKLLSGYVPPTANEINQAVETWLKIIEQYEGYFNPGYWDFFAPKDIPKELLMPFGEFAIMYGIGAAAPRIAAISNVGLGGLKKVLTLYMIMYFGAPIARDFLASSLFVPQGSNSVVYQHAYELLKNDVLLESKVVETERSKNRVRLVVESVNGKRQLIKAKRLLVSVQPSLSNLASLDLDEKEEAIFGTWLPIWSFVGVVKTPCIPENYSLSFVSPAAVPNDHLAVRDSPWTLRFDSIGPVGLGNFRILFGANYTITSPQVKEKIQTELQRTVDAGTLNFTGKCEIEWKAFSDHHSVAWGQSTEQLRDGFMQNLYGLQGYKGTWYTGGLWCGVYSSNVWALTATVLPKLLKGL
jgi:hypothetical protein